MPLYRLNPGSGSGSSGFANVGHVATAPNATGKPVTNLYYDPAIGEIVGEYDDTGYAAGAIVSNPPQDKHPITNVYWDPIQSVLVGEYDDAATGIGLEGTGQLLLE